MKTASPALQTLLASHNWFACDLYTLTLVDGTVLTYAGGDCDVRGPGNAVYACGGVTGPYWGIASGTNSVHAKLGVDVDTLTIDLLPGQATIEGVPIAQAARQGVFDGAQLRIDRAYSTAPPSATSWPVVPVGTAFRYLGFVSEIDGGGAGLTLTVSSPAVFLQAQLPRNLYQPQCVRVLGTLGCDVNLAAAALTRTSQAASTARAIIVQGAGAPGWADLGTVRFTSGALAGKSRSVRSSDGTTLTLLTPFPQAPAPGDVLVISPGCDGSLYTCAAKFANWGSFKGFPFVPAPTTAA